MNTTLKKIIVTICVCFTHSICFAQTPDIYLSFSDFGDGMAATNTSQVVPVGTSTSVYIWVNETFEILFGACLDIEVLAPAPAIVITGVEVFNPDILLLGMIPLADRWGAVSPGINMTPVSVDNVCAVILNGGGGMNGTGILVSQISGAGNPLEDALHDPASSAFLFGRVDLLAGGTGNITLDMIISEGAGGILGPPPNIDFGCVCLDVVLLGDINLDGLVNLLDVGPFVNLLSSPSFLEEADINRDGLINLLDVSPYIEILTGA